MNAHINISDGTDLPDKLAVIEWYKQLAENLAVTHQRLILNLQGQRDWCMGMLPVGDFFSAPRVLSNQQDLDGQLKQNSVPLGKAETLLGQETDCVVYDGFCGINIDVLCMAAGLVKAGGVLILLSPENPQQINDSYGQWQGRKNSKNYFFDYLHDELTQGMINISQQQFEAFPAIRSLPYSPPPQFIDDMTCQQMEVFAELNSWPGKKNIPLFVITANRGRGKSTLLGHFAQQHRADCKIVVTAASKAQVKILFNQVDVNLQNIQFIAPDEIIRRHSNIDLLIIDEAAMLPNSVLQRCLDLSEKAIIATTTGGYEGTGQGFLIKFMAGFDSTKFIHRQLTEAIRWGQQDELEKWMDRVLLLQPAAKKQNMTVEHLSVHQVSKRLLNEDKNILVDIYALLVSAHYRTRPSDLRQLMEDENQLILVAKSGSDIVGVLLLNREGGFDEELCHEIFMGRRRPQGHLFAQMITAQAGLKGFACLKGLRIQRLAVTENCRMQGVGRYLVESAEELVKELSLNYLSSSFSLDATVAPFWIKMGFSLVHISSGKGKSTGRQTVAVIKSSDAQVIANIKTLQQKINNYLAVWLLSYCQTMLWSDVYALLELLDFKDQLSTQDEDEIVAFSEGYRGFYLTQATLQKLFINQLINADLSKPLIKLCIEKVLLNKEWAELSGLNGKKESLNKLRLCVVKINKQRQ